jgi:hypothetical protein
MASLGINSLDLALAAEGAKSKQLMRSALRPSPYVISVLTGTVTGLEP